MTTQELASHLSALQLSQAEAAQLLSISPRTLRRWLEGEDIPGPAEAAFRAWAKLEKLRLPWKPDSVSIFHDDQDQIQRIRSYDQELVAMLDRVNKRGGAKDLWLVDIKNGTAGLGPVKVSFYKLMNGNFSLNIYTRKDIAPDRDRDMTLIEDAAFCIANAFSKARASAEALAAIALYTRKHSTIFVRTGPKLPDQNERIQRQRFIEAQADKLDNLAASAREGGVKYSQLEVILNELQSVSFYPELALISNATRAMI